MKTEYTLWSAVEETLASMGTQKQVQAILKTLAKACRAVAEDRERQAAEGLGENYGYTCHSVTEKAVQLRLFELPRKRQGGLVPTKLYGLVVGPQPSAAGEGLLARAPDFPSEWNLLQLADWISDESWLHLEPDETDPASPDFIGYFHMRLMLLYFAAEFFDDLAKTYKHPKKGT